MTDYANLIESFLSGAIPEVGDIEPEARFEAIVAEVWGSKQRRFGPLPTPERQVVVREVVRHSLPSGSIPFFIPWGASKERPGAPLDILEVMAVAQLGCLNAALKRFGIEAIFTVRIDDLTDQWLLGREQQRMDQIADYTRKLRALLVAALPGVKVMTESSMATYCAFDNAAAELVPMFEGYLRAEADITALEGVGWKGAIAPPTIEHYKRVMAARYPGDDAIHHTARYFAGTMARVKVKATAAAYQHSALHLSFMHPLPADGTNKPRLHYRTIPERHTHRHFAPYNATGYVEITEGGTVTPKFHTPDVVGRLVPGTVQFGGVEVAAPYLLV
jgi:hypothetical protein